MKMRHLAGLALLSSLFLYLSSPGPGYSFCVWFALCPLLIICQKSTIQQGALWGFSCGFLYYIGLLYWIIIVLGKYGTLPLWLSIAGLLLLAAYMALFISFFAACMSWCMDVMAPIWIAPVLWVALDFLRGHLFSGFPWQDLGYSHYLHPGLIQAADLVGHHGLTFIIILVNTLLFHLFLPTSYRSQARPTISWRQIVPALCLILAFNIYNFGRLEQIDARISEKTAGFAVIQPNIEQDQKWLPENKIRAVDTQIHLSEQAMKQHSIDLLIWPETALPFCPLDDPLFGEIFQRLIAAHNINLLSGAPLYTIDNSAHITVYNSALLVTGAGISETYHKQHLVPFGEYVPLPHLLPIPAPLVETMGNFSKGRSSAPLATGPIQAGMLICYESIFPELARKAVTNGANILINITNDAWFGKSSAPAQHFSMAILRAVENRRSLARSANTGISAFINPAGRILLSTDLFSPCFLTANLPLATSTSFFSRYGHFFPLGCSVSLVPLFFLIRYRKKKK